MALTATVVQNATDKAAALVQTLLDAMATVRASSPARAAGWSNGSIFSLIDAVGDPSLEIALGPAANRLDASIYEEFLHFLVYAVGNGSTQTDASPWLSNLVGNAAEKGLFNAIKSYVTSNEGGGHASVAAYLADVGAYIHPVFAEIGYAADTNAFRSNSVAPNVYSPAYGTILPSSGYVGTAGSWTSDIVDITDVGAGDVAVLAADNDCLVLGFDRKVKAIAIQASTLANVDVGLEISYSAGGSTYNTMTVTTDYTDLTEGLTKSGLIYFTVPADWLRTNVDTGGNFYSATDKTPRYYIQLKRTTDTVSTPPVLTWIKAIPEPVYTTSTGTRLSGLVTQPPLAVVRVTAENTISVLSGLVQNANYSHFQAPAYLQLEPLCVQGSPAEISALTISYVDQDGNNATKAQTISWTPALGTNEPSGSSYLALDTGDLGVRSIRTSGWTCTTTMINFVFAVTNVIPRTLAL